jgi:hypothetical protein
MGLSKEGQRAPHRKKASSIRNKIQEKAARLFDEGRGRV